MINELKIATGLRNGKTYLKESFYTRPFKLADVGLDRHDPALYLTLMSSSPGILDGDVYDIQVQLAAHTRLQLQTQSYQRIFQMEQEARQTMQVMLEDGAMLSYIPHPLVPHKNAVFKAHNKITVGAGSRLLWGEIVTCGRKLSGEVFQFKLLRNLTEIYQNGRLLLKDNQVMAPALIPPEVMGQLEGHTHQATFIYVDTTPGANLFEENIRALIPGDIVCGVTRAAGPAVVARMLAQGGEQLYDCLQRIATAIWTNEIVHYTNTSEHER
ncbi:urease accessory protein UreD [Chitinophaga horti]|uniref:Urease accessory protein UreD n=1 Tax=Chitinophaga horti TaxID=2920382 RepID=A0ABY6IXI1_9BACT|nr:urease accessory protein UreD [Chitinophaga horti]UYQ91948.1 urease accessory protein UreD [Chitinophaga horti]